jgi:hypothetical protein
MAITNREATQAREVIYHELDLRLVMEYARRHHHWDDATTAAAEAIYRDFLWVCWNYDRHEPGFAAISIRADEVWHAHMLLPAKYRDDCAAIWGPGVVLDHTPKLLTGERVSDADEAAARAEYARLNVPLPADIRDDCVWAVVP